MNLGNTGDMTYYAQLIGDVEGSQKIEELQSHDHDNYEIYEKAIKILEIYWLEDENEETQQRLGGNQFPVPSMGFNFS